MPGPVLFFDPLSQPSRACYWAILANDAEKDVQLVPLQLTAGDHLGAEYLTINPYHTVPCLKDDDLILNESGAILQYLAEKQNWTKVTIPTVEADIKTRYNAINYLHWHHFRFRKQMHQAVAERLKPILYKKPTDVDRIKTVMEECKEWLPIFDKQIEKFGGYVAGSYLTLADFQCYGEVSYYLTNEYGLDIFNFKEYPNITAWIQKMQSAPKFAEAHKACKRVSQIILNLGIQVNQD